MAEQELIQYKAHYALLEKELQELKPKSLKLTSFKRTKFQGKNHEDFEKFITRFEVEKVLNANRFTGWTNEQKTSFLISALEGKALEVVRASITIHTLNAFNKYTTALHYAYRDTSAGERALAKLQKLSQTGSVETYIREFNTLLGLASKIATLDANTVFQGFLRGLRDKMKLGVAAMDPTDLAAAQKSARALDLVLNDKDGNKPEPMDTSMGQEECSKSTCNWCSYCGHFEYECRQKASGKSKREKLPKQQEKKDTFNTKCFRCGHEGHCIKDCRTHVVFSSKEAEDNKDMKQYSSACKSILLPASKSLPHRKQPPESGSSKKAGVLPEVGREGSHNYDPLTTPQRVG
jgi:hypothetical protein